MVTVEARPSGMGDHRDRNFSTGAPNNKWVTDIGYIRMAGHWRYVFVVFDSYSGLVVGWPKRRRLDMQQQGERLLTQPSVRTG